MMNVSTVRRRAVYLATWLGLHVPTKKSLPLPDIEPWIHNCLARCLHPSVLIYPGFKANSPKMCDSRFFPLLRTNVNLKPILFFRTLVIGLVARLAFLWLWFAVPAVTKRLGEWAVGNVVCFHASVSRDICHPLSTQTDVHMCPTFCSRALHVSTSSQHFIFLIALYAYGRKIMSFFVCLYCVAWCPRTDFNLNTSWVTSKVNTVRVSQPVSLYIDLNVGFCVLIDVPNQTHVALCRWLIRIDCWRHSCRFVSLGTVQSLV
jgi:hypothetical protein